MRVSREEMARSHARIVEQAAGLLRERGMADTSVADVMTSAGLTHGGFYRHFENKQALVAAAIDTAFAQMLGRMAENQKLRANEEARAAMHDYYLSERHLGDASSACPVATMAGEVARASPELKAAFGVGVSKMVDSLADCHAGGAEAARQAALREFAMLVGAAVIARASDPVTGEQVLEACRPLSA